MTGIMKYLLVAVLAAVTAAGCSTEKVLEPEPERNNIELNAFRSHIITRSGDRTTEFDSGTEYGIFIRDDSGWLVQAYGENASVETADHVIDYGSPVVFGDSPMDFYGTTYGTQTAPDIVFSANNTPAVSASVSPDGTLPDLMFSRNLLQRTGAGGSILEMDFRHAFCKLNVQVVKQDEGDDDIRLLDEAVIKKIVINGTHADGTLDLVKGSWSYDSDTQDRTYCTSDSGLELTTTPVSVSPDSGAEFYIFPNSDLSQVSLTVTVDGVRDETGQDTGEVSRTYNVRRINDNSGEDLGVFEFLPNHEYTLIVTVLKDDVRTIAIAPLKYEWIDHDIVIGDISAGADAFMGQPVTFANQMWMDRNLGAQSADCENDWWNCRGYYYQYGRNIPFIVDMDRYADAVKKPQDSPDPLRYMYLYTFNEHGERVYGGFEARSITAEGSVTPAGIAVRAPNVAMMPGESGKIYNFVYDIGNAGTWLYAPGSNSEDPSVNLMWTGSYETHPCPKGWRLPTKEDFATFIPDKTLSAPWNTVFHAPQKYTGSVSGKPEYLCYGKIGDESAMYIIKNLGRDDCYRIKIVLKETVAPDYGGYSSDEKYYYECSYYSGDASMTFDGIRTEEEFLTSDFDWSLPVATMQIPACGFIYPGGSVSDGAYSLNGDGINAILRTTDFNNSSTNWVCYLRNDGWQFGLISSSRKALGEQIRCIRDVTAF